MFRILPDIADFVDLPLYVQTFSVRRDLSAFENLSAPWYPFRDQMDAVYDCRRLYRATLSGVPMLLLVSGDCYLQVREWCHGRKARKNVR